MTEGRTVIATSHDMRFVAETFGRVLLLDRGRIVMDGTPVEVFAEANWPRLGEAGVEPPEAALLGARLGLGSTPTEPALLESLAGRLVHDPEQRSSGPPASAARNPLAT